MPTAQPPTEYPAWEDRVIGPGPGGPGWGLWTSEPGIDTGAETPGSAEAVAGVGTQDRQGSTATAQAEHISAEMLRHFAHGDHNGAFQIGREALARWHQLGRPERSCEVLITLASACMEHEQGLEALALVRHAFVLARTRVLPATLVRTLTLMATLHGRMNDTATGEALALQSLSRAREHHDQGAVLCALGGLLAVLLQAHALQLTQGDAPRTEATAQRLLRHAHQALAQSPFVPNEFSDLHLRIQAGAALMACDQVPEAMRVLRGCMEAARRQHARVAGLWARYHTAVGTLKRGSEHAAAQALHLLLPQLHADDPPRLRLAVVGLQAEMAHVKGEVQAAHRQRAALLALHEAQALQVAQLQPTLRRSADDVLGALAVLDREWLERGVPPSAQG